MVLNLKVFYLNACVKEYALTLHFTYLSTFLIQRETSCSVHALSSHREDWEQWEPLAFYNIKRKQLGSFRPVPVVKWKSPQYFQFYRVLDVGGPNVLLPGVSLIALQNYNVASHTTVDHYPWLTRTFPNIKEMFNDFSVDSFENKLNFYICKSHLFYKVLFLGHLQLMFVEKKHF